MTVDRASRAGLAGRTPIPVDRVDMVRLAPARYWLFQVEQFTRRQDGPGGQRVELGAIHVAPRWYVEMDNGRWHGTSGRLKSGN